jgi:uncharacterized protein YutE (UPF0331/DUF86 family)
MTQREIDSKISLVRQYLKLAEKFKKCSLRELQRHDELRLAVERALFLVVQAGIDLAEAFCQARKYRKPSSMHDAFYVLHEENIIDDDLLETMLRMVGFRNILTHGYAKIDNDIVMDVLKKRLNDIKKLLRAVEKT